MPEGDTVHKLARAMARELEGVALERLWLRDRSWLAPLAGRTIHEVAAVGKHLLVAIGDLDAARARWVLHVHLGMHGRWHAYAAGEAWQQPERHAALQIHAAGRCWVCFRPARAEILRRVDLALHPELSRLGPDLLAPAVDWGRVVSRARRRPGRAVVELLLDQSVACGIGNVYKSEVLFLEGVDPRTPVAQLSDAAIADLYRCARRLLAQNLGGWRRTTTRAVRPGETPHPGEPRLWVYDRAGRPCRRCATRIESARLGDAARPTWWCPRCQPRTRSVAAAPEPRAPFG